MNKFKLYRNNSYVAYESYYRFVGNEYIHAIRWNELDDLKILIKLALSKPHKSDTNNSVVFYSSNGEILTVFIDKEEDFMNKDIVTLRNFLEERSFLWLTIPDILCLNKGSNFINSRFGQTVIFKGEVYDATDYRNVNSFKVDTSRDDSDGFNIVLPTRDTIFLESSKYSDLRTNSAFMYLYTYSIKEYSCFFNRTADGWLTYRAKDLEFEVDVDESYLEFFWDKLRSLNCNNADDVCSVNYAVIEEEGRLIFTVMLTFHIDSLKRK